MDLIIRASAVFFFIWLMMKGLGKRELAEMSPFELVVLVIIGDFVQQGVTGDDRSIVGAVLAVSTLAFWVLVFSYVSFRSTRARNALEGLPVVVVRDGLPIEEHLRLERMTVDEVQAEARTQGIADLRQVRLAILEPGGQFSFVLHDGPAEQQRRKNQGPSAALRRAARPTRSRHLIAPNTEARDVESERCEDGRGGDALEVVDGAKPVQVAAVGVVGLV